MKTCSRTPSNSLVQLESGKIGYECPHRPRDNVWSSWLTRPDTSKAVSNRNEASGIHWWANEISVKKKVKTGWMAGVQDNSLFWMRTRAQVVGWGRRIRGV